MGCSGSKQERRGQCRSLAPLTRSHTMPVHHPALWKGDSCHVVYLASSTLGSLRVDPIGHDRRHWSSQFSNADADADDEDGYDPAKKTISEGKSGDLLMEEPKKDTVHPRTPIETPCREPEIIDAWEMMSGLENASPLYQFSSAQSVEKSFSFHSLEDARRDAGKLNEQMKEQPMWMKMDTDGGVTADVISDFDPDAISSFRKAMDRASGKKESVDLSSTVRSRIIAFQEKINANRARANVKLNLPALGKGKVIFYFTSLRGVRRTFQDCCFVREILRGYAVRVDERDVSMHGGFKEELACIFGPHHHSFKLPKVFANGKFLGGADEIRQLHDEGELAEALKGCEEKENVKDSSCKGCGGVRFVPCEGCCGSCKIYVEDAPEYGGFRRCPDCNENGLVRCPLCWAM